MTRSTASQGSRGLAKSADVAAMQNMALSLQKKYNCNEEEMAEALASMLGGKELPSTENAARLFAQALTQRAEKKSLTADRARDIFNSML